MLAKFRNIAFSLGILLLILACSNPAPPATPSRPPEPTALPTQGPVAGVAPTPVLTPETALTATPAPTATPQPAAAEQPTAAPQPVTEPATATPAPLPTATTAPLPTPTPAPPPTTTPTPAPTPTPTPAERDRAILTDFYHAMDGPNWANNTNWLTDAPLNEWYGVQYYASEYLNLNLRANRLKGEIPAELGDLADLERLDLSSNLLSGCIPLTLVYNRSLETAEFGLLKPCKSPDRETLVSLYHATGGPDWDWWDRTEGEDWLTDASLDEWRGVDVVDGYDEGDIGRVKGLSLPVSGGIPAALLTDLPELRSLYLYGSQLTGEIPPELGNLDNLRWLTLTDSQLTGEIPPELGNLVNLRHLDLSDNQLTGEIPPELGNLVNLTYTGGSTASLNLSNNQLTGAIPPELGNLVNLDGLDLSRNQLTGPIPPELGNLVYLRNGLDLADNQLTGAIPPELGNLGDWVNWLDLANNQLTGPIPPELGNLGYLERLDLSNNQLTGPIPPELVYLTGLRSQLQLTGNQFSGCVSRHLEQIEINPADLGLEWCP